MLHIIVNPLVCRGEACLALATIGDIESGFSINGVSCFGGNELPLCKYVNLLPGLGAHSAL